MNTIAVQDLKKSYFVDTVETMVLRGISLEIKASESLCLFGPSGAGKSTLLYLLGCLEKPTSGSVIINGKNINEYSDGDQALFRNMKMGFVFQFHHLLPDFTALENVMMPLLIAGVSEKKATEEATLVLNEMGLKRRFHHKPSELSGGEQQRVAVARACVHKPDFIFADEPTGNLDHENGAKIFDLLLGLNRELRSTLIVVTHNESVINLFNRKIRLVDGLIHES